MRAAVIIGCLLVFLIVCLLGVGLGMSGLAWQRARVARTQAMYAQMVEQEAVRAAEAAEARAVLKRDVAAEAQEGDGVPETLQEAISKVTW